MYDKQVILLFSFNRHAKREGNDSLKKHRQPIIIQFKARADGVPAQSSNHMGTMINSFTNLVEMAKKHNIQRLTGKIHRNGFLFLRIGLP